MPTFNNIGLQEPSTITKTVAAVQIQRNSSNELQEILCLGDSESTLGVARVTAAGGVPSTTYGLVVRLAGGPSSAADATFRVDQGLGNSSAADRWRVMTANSSAADYNAVRLVDSSGTGYHGPTNPLPTALTDSSNAVVKAGDSANNAIRVNVVAGAAAGSTNVTISTPALQGYAASTAGQSTATTIVSSNANTIGYVMAYKVTSTVAGPINAGFYAGSNLVWPVLLWADGGIPRDGEQVSYPSFLFKGSTGVPLTFNVASTGDYRVAVTYWTA